MVDLLTEANGCKTIDACIELAGRDSYSEYEEAEGWLTCFEEVFEEVKTAKLLGEEVLIEKFKLIGELSLVVVCKRKNKKAKVTPDSLEFDNLSKVQLLWIKSWKKWSRS
jgi:hypothetical protein